MYRRPTVASSLYLCALGTSILNSSPASPPDSIPVLRDDVYRDAHRVTRRGFGANLLLVVIKLSGGIATGSAALIADAVNSIGDVGSAIAVHGALHVAQQDEDEDHPYGHTKAESIAGISIALLIIFSAVVLALETIRQIHTVQQAPPLLAGWIAIACGMVKEGLYHYTHRAASSLASASLRASAWDHRSDALASTAVGVALLVSPYLGPAAPYVDPIAALGVCMLLVVVGIGLFVRTATELMDQQANVELIDEIRRVASDRPHVAAVEKLRVRKSGLEYFAEIHVQVDGRLTVSEGHRIGHEVKDALLAAYPRIRDVHVHIEPFDV